MGAWTAEGRGSIARTPRAAFAAAALLVLPLPAPLPDAWPAAELAPDLVVLTLAWAPRHPVPGDSVVFTALVHNQGDAPAPESLTAFRLDGATLDLRPTAPLAPGDTLAVSSSPWTAVDGLHQALAAADDGSWVPESNETNNARTGLVNVTWTRPDLRIAALAWAPLHPVTGEPVTFTAEVRNDGNASAAASRVRFFFDGLDPGPDVAVPVLAAGERANATSAPWAPTRNGTHLVMAYADPLDEVPESREGNNQRVAELDVADAPLPDLVVALLSLDPAAPTAGENVTVRVQVRNLGPAAAPPSVLNLSLPGRVELLPTPGLAPDASVELAGAPWAALAGEHVLSVSADAAADVAEADEANNHRLLPFVVEPSGPDFTVVRVLVPEDALPGMEVRFRAEVRNLGNRAGTFGGAFEVDGAALPGSLDGALAPGDALLLTSPPWNATLGDHRVRMTVGSTSAPELRLDNNEGEEAFCVPRLRVTGPQVELCLPLRPP